MNFDAGTSTIDLGAVGNQNLSGSVNIDSQGQGSASFSNVIELFKML